MLAARGVNFLTPNAATEIAHGLKEARSYVAISAEGFEEDGKTMDDGGMVERGGENYNLPDGGVIRTGREQMAPEILFRHRGGRGGGGGGGGGNDVLAEGFPAAVYACAQFCDVDIRSDLMNNIVLCGGNTMFPGFQERMEREMEALLPPTMTFKVTAAPDRKYAAWIGGSILASLSTFQQMWVTKAEYDEQGPTVRNRVCF